MPSLGNMIPSYAVSVVWERQEPPFVNCNPELFLTSLSLDVRYTYCIVIFYHAIMNMISLYRAMISCFSSITEATEVSFTISISQSNISLINKTSVWWVITSVRNTCTLKFKSYFTHNFPRQQILHYYSA